MSKEKGAVFPNKCKTRKHWNLAKAFIKSQVAKEANEGLRESLRLSLFLRCYAKSLLSMIESDNFLWLLSTVFERSRKTSPDFVIPAQILF